MKTENKPKTKRILIEGQAKLSEILNGKRRKVVEADHQASVALAVERMCFHKVGSVVVVNQWEPVGLFTERDLMHRVVNKKPGPCGNPAQIGDDHPVRRWFPRDECDRSCRTDERQPDPASARLR